MFLLLLLLLVLLLLLFPQRTCGVDAGSGLAEGRVETRAAAGALLWPLFLLLGSLNGNFTSDRRGERVRVDSSLSLSPPPPRLSFRSTTRTPLLGDRRSELPSNLLAPSLGETFQAPPPIAILPTLLFLQRFFSNQTLPPPPPSSMPCVCVCVYTHGMTPSLLQFNRPRGHQFSSPRASIPIVHKIKNIEPFDYLFASTR